MVKQSQVQLSLSVFAIPLSFLLLTSVAISEEKIHVVKKGDSIAKIANEYGVSQRDLRDANGIGKGTIIDIGDHLIIPDVLRSGVAKQHTIKQGDTLLKIAKKHKVTVADLLTVNRMTKTDKLSAGKTLLIPGLQEEDFALPVSATKQISIEGGKPVKGGIMHTVQQGQSIWLIARAYNTTGDKIAARNRIDKTAPLKIGQELFIPTASASVSSKTKAAGPGAVRFVRVHNNIRLTLRLFNKKGRINQQSRLELSKLARDRKGKKRYRLLHPRLIQLIQKTADHYPGQTIEIVSGYRAPQSKKSRSKHGLGHALDFRVADVPNKELYEFLKTLPKTGTGYYPNSTFVHLDVRDKSYTWIDVSRSGERSQYVKPEEQEKISADSQAGSPADTERDDAEDDLFL